MKKKEFVYPPVGTWKEVRGQRGEVKGTEVRERRKREVKVRMLKRGWRLLAFVCWRLFALVGYNRFFHQEGDMVKERANELLQPRCLMRVKQIDAHVGDVKKWR